CRVDRAGEVGGFPVGRMPVDRTGRSPAAAGEGDREKDGTRRGGLPNAHKADLSRRAPRPRRNVILPPASLPRHARTVSPPASPRAGPPGPPRMDGPAWTTWLGREAASRRSWLATDGPG